MTKYASANAVRNLLHSLTVSTLHLVLRTIMEHWLAVANKMQHGLNNIGALVLSMLKGTSSEAAKAVKAIASAIWQDHNMLILELQMENGFRDEGGVTLAKQALTVNKTPLRVIELTSITRGSLKLLLVPEPTRPLVPCCALSFLRWTRLVDIEGFLVLVTRCVLSSN
jgi:hypothetical protein